MAKQKSIIADGDRVWPNAKERRRRARQLGRTRLRKMLRELLRNPNLPEALRRRVERGL